MDAKCTTQEKMAKFDPSYKSKRYRDKIRTAVKELEALLPLDKTKVHRKLDSQTVFRLAIAYFRTKLFLQAAGIISLNRIEDRKEKEESLYHYATIGSTNRHTRRDFRLETANRLSAILEEVEKSLFQEDLEQGRELVEAFGGVLLVVTSDGTILFVSDNILQHLGFNQVDLMLRCIYGIVHPDDQQEMKIILESALNSGTVVNGNQQRPCCLQNGAVNTGATCRAVSFLCRMKCFNGTTAGYLKMHCMGHMRSFPNVTKSQRTSNQVLFALCRPFVTIQADEETDDVSRSNGFWTKHDLDLKFKAVEDKTNQALGYSQEELIGRSLYSFIHPEDLPVITTCHRTLLHSDDVQTTYFRVERKDGGFSWLHSRCRILAKNSKKYAILCTHCPVREEDSTFIQQEAVARRRNPLQELTSLMTDPELLTQNSPQTAAKFQFNLYGGLRDDPRTGSLHDPHGFCPSSWHSGNDRHSPVFPTLFPPDTQPHPHPHNPLPPPSGCYPYDADQELGCGDIAAYNPRFVSNHPNYTPLNHHPNHPYRRRQSCALDSSESSGHFRNYSAPYADQRNANYVCYNQESNQLLCSNRLHHQCHRQQPQQLMMNPSSSSSLYHHHPSSHPTTQMFFSNNNYFITYNIDSSSSADNYDTGATCPPPPQQYSKRDAALHSPDGGPTNTVCAVHSPGGATNNTSHGVHSPGGATNNTFCGVHSPAGASANTFRGVLQFAGGHQRSSSSAENGQDAYSREPALVQYAEKKSSVAIDWPLVRSIGSSCQYYPM